MLNRIEKKSWKANQDYSKGIKQKSHLKWMRAVTAKCTIFDFLRRLFRIDGKAPWTKEASSTNAITGSSNFKASGCCQKRTNLKIGVITNKFQISFPIANSKKMELAHRLAQLFSCMPTYNDKHDLINAELIRHKMEVLRKNAEDARVGVTNWLYRMKAVAASLLSHFHSLESYPRD